MNLERPETSPPNVTLPAGFGLAFFETLDSTNAEALRRVEQGAPDRLWIWARRQTAGRGRAGRQWASPPGGLYVSLLMRLGCPLDVGLQLVFVAGLALHDAVAGTVPERPLLKWPNDLLLAGRKAGGILLESLASGGDGGPAVVIGTGLNLAAHPQNALKPATDLASRGVVLSVRQAFERLAGATARRLEQWDEGRGFDRTRRCWQDRALTLGQPIRVGLADRQLTGTYGGIEDDGALRLIESDGRVCRISTGDVFLGEPAQG